MIKPSAFCAILISALAMAAAGCGYHLSGTVDPDSEYHSTTLYRPDVHTVAVPIFANRSFYQGVEFRLTKAIINTLEAQSPYKVAPKERADTILEGEITNVRLQTISNNVTSAVSQEQMYSIVVRFTWRDLRDGKILAQRLEFEQTAPFYPTLGEDQFVGEQLNIERLSLAIVQQLESDWGVHKTPDDAAANP